MSVTPTSASPPTVLLVDAEPSFRGLAAFLLETDGCRVLTAATVEEANRLADQRRLRVDVLVIDLNLPADDGLGAATELRARWPELKVLYSFQDDADTPIDQTLLDPRSPVVLKPLGLTGICKQVRQLLGDRGHRTAEPVSASPTVAFDGDTWADRPVESSVPLPQPRHRRALVGVL